MPESSLITRFRQSLEFVLGIPFTDGNQVTPLHNGVEIFPAMLNAIDAAQYTIDFLTFVYWQGDIADTFAQKLAARAQAGVQVRVLLDAFGAKSIDQAAIDQMQEAGCEIRWFRPLSTWRIWRADKRTHRKILVCDNELGFTGGVGIADEWQGNANNSTEWRDCHFKIHGPVVKGLKAAFLDNWNEAGEWSIEAGPETPLLAEDDIPIQLVRASSTVGWTDISSLDRALISLAQNKITLATAYFSPDSVLVKMLCEALDRGVNVTILTTGEQTDSRLSQLAGQRHYQTLLDSGASIYLYRKTMLHAKLFLLDDALVCFGSANLNHRSMSKDEECCLVALSEQLNQNLVHRIENDLADSLLLEASTWQQRSWVERFQEQLAGLLVEQL